MTNRIKVLAICVHNSARSQITEEFLRLYGDGRVAVESAGLEPGEINPLVSEVMLEEGIDLRGKKTQSVFDLFRSGALYDYVITVCNVEQSDRCPVFPGVTQRLHWELDDPSALQGTHEEKLEKVRVLRESIREQAKAFVASLPDA